ncbi:sensor histidine kinase [Skermanella stibiiresistens]|uniref:sensor histidine kinase n=1 Tax=Skermanella stibiiresistens TaxID=913326 RepID=UPI0018DCC3C2|nr:ATP-binding protein [Skermanella stibiiresistens]
MATKLLCSLLLALALVFVGVQALSREIDDIHFDVLAAHTFGKAAEVLTKKIRWSEDGRPLAIELPPDLEWLPRALQMDIHYRLIDAAGNTILSSPGQAETPRSGGTADDISAFRTGVFSVGSDEHPHWLYLSMSERLLHLLRTQVISSPTALATTILGLVAVTLIVLIALRRLLRPLREASAAAGTISPNNLHQRLSTDGMPLEIRPLINAFNNALERLEDGFRVQQEFLASAAHELKTPLALIRGQIELETDFASREMLLMDVDLMARQVHQLLHLAELSELQNYRFETVDLSAVAVDVVRYMERQAVQNRTSFNLLLPGLPVPHTADASAIFILLKNLVENAILHSPPSGVVTVVVTADELRVTDMGAGLRPEDLPKLFTRFWRGPTRGQQGAGLGLSICREITLAHRWSIRASTLGPGTSFIVSLT